MMRRRITNRVVHTIPFTKDGFETIKREQKQLLEERPKAVADLQKAREMGDLSENGYYKSARAKLSQIDRRLREVDYLLKFGKVTETTSAQTVDIGTIVTVKDTYGEREFTLVGSHEANPIAGKLSLNSPIGKALSGHKIGDKVSVQVPQGTITYTIISLRTA